MKTVCIIGGGFSGTLTAIHLLKKDPDIAVTIINSKYPVPQGIAYHTKRPEHLLNVPAGKMSPFSDQPNLFSSWLKKNTITDSVSDLKSAFVPRLMYGKFLKEFSASYLKNKRLSIISEKAIAVKHHKDHYEIELADHSIIDAEYLVLAMGNFVPALPDLADCTGLKNRNYFNNPWNEVYLMDIKKEDNVLLIGSGLTMIDCVLSLLAEGHIGSVYAVSPHGYIAESHASSASQYPDFSNEFKDKDLNQLFSLIRKHLKIAASREIPWQSVIDIVRPHVQELWLSFSGKEKQRFMSHLRHIWGVARHRLPTEIHGKISQLMNSGRLRIIGGRIESVFYSGSFDVTVRLRKKTYNEVIRVSRIVNCTGPQGNYAAINDPLIESLLAESLIIPDELRLGVKATKKGKLLYKNGKPVKNLYAVGSLLRGVLWENTSVPDIRKNAENVASQIINSID